MRNEHLKTRLTQIPFPEIMHRVAEWRRQREYWQANSVQPAKKKARAKKSKLETMLAGLTPEQRAALIAELES